MSKFGHKTFLGISLGAMTLSCFCTTSCNNIEYKYPNYSLVCMGDSITYGIKPFGGRMAFAYPEILQEKLSFGKSYNYGVSGSTITSGQHSFSPMVNRIIDMEKNATIVIFWGGVNDYIRGTELGKKGDTTTATIYGSLDNIASYLKQTYANKFVMFMTPLPTTVESSKYKLTDVCDAISYTCDRYDFYLLDLYKESGFEQEMKKSYSDGLHPTQQFITNSIVPKIYKFIKEKFIF